MQHVRRIRVAHGHLIGDELVGFRIAKHELERGHHRFRVVGRFRARHQLDEQRRPTAAAAVVLGDVVVRVAVSQKYAGHVEPSAARGVRPERRPERATEIVVGSSFDRKLEIEGDRHHEEAELLLEDLAHRPHVLEEVEIAVSLLSQPAHELDVEVAPEPDRGEPDAVGVVAAAQPENTGSVGDARRRLAVAQQDHAVLPSRIVGAGELPVSRFEPRSQIRSTLCHQRARDPPELGPLIFDCGERSPELRSVTVSDERQPIAVLHPVDQELEPLAHELDLLALHRSGNVDHDRQ